MTDEEFEFLPDGGETGALIRSIDWSGHPLGRPAMWPQHLKITLSTMLGSRHPMFLWWGDNLFQFYNDAYVPSFGLGKHPIAMGQRGVDCWPEIWLIIEPQIKSVLTQKKATWNEDQLVPIFRNGQVEDVYWSYGYSPIFGDKGGVCGVLVVCTETTGQVVANQRLARAAENLRAAVNVRDTFLAIASHELNTPLTSLKLRVQRSQRMLRKEGAQRFTADQLEALLDNFATQTARLERLVADMLDVSRINSGEMALTLADTDLSALTVNILEALQPQLKASGCSLSTHIAPALVIRLDASRVEQVVSNFIINAVKYAPKTHIEVRLEPVDSNVRLSVQDGGKGIAENDLNRIFGRFERATSRTEVSGLGLGLYICKQIIEAHGGSVRASSKLGTGSTFSFQLPNAHNSVLDSAALGRATAG